MQVASFNRFLFNKRTVIIFKKQWITHAVPTLPEITVPIPMKAIIKRVVAKKKYKELEKQKQQSRLGDKATPIITTKRKLLTHYKHQVYDKFKPLPLYTKGWHNRKSNGDHFQIQGFDTNPALSNSSDTESESPSDFTSFNLSEDVLLGLERLNAKIPTNIQTLAIPHIIKRENVICAAETGSGKTIAYLAPIIHNILLHKSCASYLCNNSPLCLILVPSRELAQQIGNVADTITKGLQFKTKVLVGGTGATQRAVYNPPLHNVDIIVTTLGAFKKLVFTKVYSVNSVRHLVIDEADTMLDDSFNESLIKFLNRFNFREPVSAESGTQLCLVGATLPRDLVHILNPVIEVNSMEKITTNHLHRIMPHVPQRFLKLKSSDKPIRLLELVKNDLSKKKPVIIFSKNRSTSDYVNMFLEENGIKNVNLDGEMPAKFRVGQFEKFQNGDVDVISCTDIGSRGLDTLRVQHVINYDFPSFISDYIHRAGRTGRVGSKVTGHVTNFISKSYEVELVQKIEIAVRSMESLPNVNANIKRKLFGDQRAEIEMSEYI